MESIPLGGGYIPSYPGTYPGMEHPSTRAINCHIPALPQGAANSASRSGAPINQLIKAPHKATQTVHNTKGTRAHMHKELIREWFWEPKGSSLEYI